MTAHGPLWRLLGLLLTAAALGFVGWTIHQAGLTRDPAWRDPALWLVTAVAGVVYVLALLLVAGGWWLLVRGAEVDGMLRIRTGLRIYGVSQLYKYLPSNMLHYVGRHAALRQLGIGHSAAAIGALGEVALLLPASLVAAALGAQFALVPIDSRIAGLLAGTVVLGACGIALCRLGAPTLGRLPRIEKLARLLESARLREAALRAFACYLIFFALSGAAFALVACGIGPWRLSDAPLMVAIWAGCWALGFVTPGAPAGLGVREALLIAALTAAGGGETAALTAIAMRVATLLGDLLLAAIGHAAGRGAAAPSLKAPDARASA